MECLLETKLEGRLHFLGISSRERIMAKQKKQIRARIYGICCAHKGLGIMGEGRRGDRRESKVHIFLCVVDFV